VSEANEARKRISFKNDLEMWHKFVGFAAWLMMIARIEEQRLYEQCIHYSYDDEAYEEYCNCKEIDREIKEGPLQGVPKDFDASEECWHCLHYKRKERVHRKHGR